MARGKAASIFVVLLLAAIGAGPTPTNAQTRGVDIRMRESEAPGAKIAGTVRLYGASHALVIGIDQYRDPAWQKLRNAVRDARVVAEELKRLGFEVTLKTDPASADLQSTLKEFFARRGSDPEARLLFWYAGHGDTVEGEGFLVPADAPARNHPDFLLKALPMRDFGTLVRLARAKHVLSVFDSCFAGTVFEARTGAAPAAITKKTTEPVRQFITAGDAKQAVRDDGSFREYFVRALKGEEKADFNDDGYVTGEELGLFLSQRMSALTNAAQTPRWGRLLDVRWDKGDFVFALPGGAAVAALPPAAAPAPEAIGVGKGDKPAFPEIEAIDREYAAAEAARVRSAPDVRASQLGSLKEGQSVHVLGKVK
ncbi:MAG: caspase family protein, partial [Alphaproteobacteria bacterium]|nr:caspase family protein [Alphaproteobacteria bacterium]